MDRVRRTARFSVDTVVFRMLWAGFLAGYCLLAATAPDVQAQVAFVGPEFLVNTTTSFDQEMAAVSHGPSGEYLVVWESRGQDGDGFDFGVFGQRFSSSGAVVGTEFQVNSTTSGDQVFPALSHDDDGDFVVVWVSPRPNDDPDGIFGQRYSSSGAPLGTEFPISTDTAAGHTKPAVSHGTSGDFVVIWEDGFQDSGTVGVFGRRFSSSGQPAGTEFKVHTTTSGDQANPDLSHSSSGDFVVVWGDGNFSGGDGQDGSSFGVFGRRFSSSGAPLGGEFLVNTTTVDPQNNPSVSHAPAGDFMVVWQSRDQDGDGYGVFGQRFDSGGAPLGTEFPVNESTAGAQMNPDVAHSQSGEVQVVWESTGGDDGEVYGRRFDSARAALGPEFVINSYLPTAQTKPVVSGSSDSNFAVAWQSYTNQDGFGKGVFGQRLGESTTASIQVCSEPNEPIDNTFGSIVTNDSIVVTEELTITDVNLTLEIEHTGVGDLKASLSASITQGPFLLNTAVATGEFMACDGDDINVVLDNERDLSCSSCQTGEPCVENECEASVDEHCLETESPAISGVKLPSDASSLSQWNGSSSARTWTLSVVDVCGSSNCQGNQDSGTLKRWCLDIQGAAPSPTPSPTAPPTATQTPGGPTATASPAPPTATPTQRPCPDCNDDDRDGVPNCWDECTGTSLSAFVNPDGCPGSQVRSVDVGWLLAVGLPLLWLLLSWLKQRGGRAPMFRRLRMLLMLVFAGLLLVSLSPPAWSQEVRQERGVDQRVDYQSLALIGPWDDRNYQLTAEDLALLAPNESELGEPIPVFYRVLMRKRFPGMQRTGEAQYPESALPRFLREFGGYEIDGELYGRVIREGERLVVLKTEGAVRRPEPGRDLNGEVLVSQGCTASAESAVALNPVDQQQAITAVMSNTNFFGAVGQCMYRSSDGGETWNDSPTVLPRDSDDPNICCDPTVAWSSDGSFAYTATLGDFNVQTNACCFVYFYRSADGGVTWDDLKNVGSGDVNRELGNTNNPNNAVADKEYLHVDIHPTSPHRDNLYLTWKENADTYFARSTDFGNTWTEQRISGPNGIGADITSDRQGNVYLIYPATGSRSIVVHKSTNGGVSFASAVTIASTEGSFIFPIPSQSVRQVFIYASADTDRTNGPHADSIYVAWTDNTGLDSGTASNNHARIRVARSRDGGASWQVTTPHETADQNSVDRWHQWLGVDGQGGVHVVFYDTRQDPTRTSVDLYHSFSYDGGETFSTPARISSVSSPKIGNPFEFGDYNGMDVQSDRLLAIYTDNRVERTSRGDSQDVYVAGQTVGTPMATATPTVAPTPIPTPTLRPCGSCVDSDFDGVPDCWDSCPGTGGEVFVDENGCPGNVLPSTRRRNQILVGILFFLGAIGIRRRLAGSVISGKG